MNKICFQSFLILIGAAVVVPMQSWALEEHSLYSLTFQAETPEFGSGDVSVAMRTTPGAWMPQLLGRVGIGAGWSLDAQVSEEFAGADAAPAVGLQRQLIGTGGSQGGSLAVRGVYKSESFSDFGGELEFQLIGGWRSGPAELALNLVAGKDFDQPTGDVEVHAVAAYSLLPSVLAGVESEAIRAMGPLSPGDTAQTFFAGPLVRYQYERFSVSASTGVYLRWLETDSAAADMLAEAQLNARVAMIF